jgi:tetratricopeptide (TPR) repeat protein
MSVTGEYALVGRSAFLDEACRLVAQAASSSRRGGMVFIDGEHGTGKSLLLQMVQEKSSQQLREASEEEFRFESVNCNQTDQAVAYQPFIELLTSLTKGARDRQRIGKHITSILKEVAPDLLQLIPGAGPLLAAGAKGLATIGDRALEATGPTRLSHEEGLVAQWVDGLVAIASKYSPLVLIIDDAQFIDPFSCQLLRRLARRAQECPLVILVAHQSLDLMLDSPSIKALQAARAELFKRREAEAWELKGFSGPDIQKYLDIQFQGSLRAPNLVEWLLDLTRGNPHFITSYLLVLKKMDIIRQEQGRFILDGAIRRQGDDWILEGKLAAINTPSDIDAVLKLIVGQLDDKARHMLGVGAVQGNRFKSLLLAEILKEEEPQITDKLTQLVDQRRIVRFYTLAQWENASSAVFGFESILLHDALYQQFPPTKRGYYHQLIAQVLQRYIAKGSSNLYNLLKEAAYHYDMARGNMPWEAAQAYYKAAQLAYDKGFFMEVYHLCLQGLANLRAAPNDGDERDPLMAQLTLLAVASQEMRVPGPGMKAEERELVALLTEGQQAAQRARDPKVLAHLMYLHGRLLIALADVPSALRVMLGALDVARKSGDPLTEMVVLSGLGTQFTKESLTEGRRFLQEAWEVYVQRLAPKPPETQTPTIVERHFRRLEMMIGLAEFDLGHFDEALRLLKSGVDGLRRLKMLDDLLFGLNYLAQLYMAMGAFEDAEATLVEAHKPFENDEQPNAADGYNVGLLGKVYLEWGRFDEAARVLSVAYVESELAANRDMVTIVRNYSAELWMHPAFPGNDFQKARQVLEGNLRDSLAWGLDRSTVVAQSLLSRLELIQDHSSRAFEYSQQAVSLIEKKGAMPAVRTEEILFHHSRVARDQGDRPEADRYLALAYGTVKAKADSLEDVARRRRFLERVPLNRAIQRELEQHVGRDADGF